MLEGERIAVDLTLPSAEVLQHQDKLELDFALGCQGRMDAGGNDWPTLLLRGGQGRWDY